MIDTIDNDKKSGFRTTWIFAIAKDSVLLVTLNPSSQLEFRFVKKCVGWFITHENREWRARFCK